VWTDESHGKPPLPSRQERPAGSAKPVAKLAVVLAACLGGAWLLSGSGAPTHDGTAAATAQPAKSPSVSANDVSGKVLPFTVVRATRNHAFKEGIVIADVSVSVEGGEPDDWMATGVYVAEHAIVGDVTATEVLVIIPNPGADFPPQMPKELAKVYFDPNTRMWDKKWLVLGAGHAGTLADLEYYELGDQLLDGTITDPDKQQEKADNAARKIVIKKYGLPKDWKSKIDDVTYLGLHETTLDRENIHITVPDGIAESMASLQGCLSRNVNGTSVMPGCMPTNKEVAIDTVAVMGSPEVHNGQGNSDCWGDDQRQDISCQNLTEAFLLSMRNAPMATVRAAMKVAGRDVGNGQQSELHFISNYSRGSRWGSGDVNFLFDAKGRVEVISASLDPPYMNGKSADFTWNRGLMPNGCSDLPNSKLHRCTAE
jgi:hypothetical protein